MRAILLLSVSLGLAAAESHGPGPAGGHPDVEFQVLFARGERLAPVSTGFAFHGGDRFALRVRLARSSYVYVLSRPRPGAGTDDSTIQPPYTLVYPRAAERAIPAGAWRVLPRHNMEMQMDAARGVEQLLLIVSPRGSQLPDGPAAGA